MSAEFLASPVKAPFPVDAFMQLSAQEQSDIALPRFRHSTGGLCDIPVQVGLFFDGTNNNLERDRNGRRIAVPGGQIPVVPRPMRPEECSHSNIARLFRTFPDDKRAARRRPLLRVFGQHTAFTETRCGAIPQ